MNAQAFFEVLGWAQVMSSVLLGLLIGSLYAWDQEAEPVTLWAVGVSFVIMISVYSAISGDSENPWEWAAARAVLWTATCTAIHFGKLARRRVQMQATRKRMKHLQEENRYDHGR